MKYLLTLSFLVAFFSAGAQSYTRDSVNVPYTSSASPTTKCLVYKRTNYAANTSYKYPLLVFLHGRGEAGTSLSKIYTSSSSGGAPYFIEQGTFPASFTVNGTTHEFLVIAPQRNNDWSASGQEADYIIRYIVQNFRVDTNRIYIYGLSAGGAGTIEYASGLDPNETDTTLVVRYKAAAIVPHAPATNSPQSKWAKKTINDSVHVWGMGDPEGDVYGEWAMNYSNLINGYKANWARFTNTNAGHSSFNTQFSPSYTETINGTSMNIYQWMLQYARGTASSGGSGGMHTLPVTDAGANQSISLPTTTATVTATRTLYDNASATTYQWSKLRSPAGGKYKVTVAGSSTAAGFGLTSGVSFVDRLRDYYTSIGLVDSIRNIAVGGTSPWDLDYVALFTGNPNIVLINYPTNAFDNAGNTASVIAQKFQEIKDSCTVHNAQFFLTGTQPRNFTLANRQKLKIINDTLRNRFGDRFIDFFTYSADTASANLYNIYTSLNQGDSVHQNAQGHAVMFEAVKAVNIFKYSVSGTSSISSAGSLSTNITSLAQGTHVFQFSVLDNYGGYASDTVRIIVSAAGNASPIANAGSDQSITLPVSTVTLTGSGTDSDGSIVSYNWVKTSGPTSGMISSASSASTTVTGLVQGLYTFTLTVTDNNGATATDNMNVVVNPIAALCSYTAYNPVPDAGDSGYWNTYDLQPGDTLFIDGSKAWSYIYIEGKNGTPSCPIVIMNKNGQAKLTGDFAQLKLRSCSYFKVLGTGTAGVTYGFHIQPYPTGTIVNGTFALSIEGRSKNIEVSNVSISHAGIGMNIKEDGDCDPLYNYPNWVIDSILIHHNRIVKTWNQGMYIGNTSPDNGPTSYDVRPVVCNGVTTYPRPVRMGDIKVYNNIVDSTGRAGIQLASASTGLSEIYNNTITHNGMGGDEQQGAGINLGTYSNVWVYNNTIRNTLAYGISSFGASSTGNTLKIENNLIDSSGYLNHYGFGDWSTDIIQFATRAVTTNTLTWPYSICIYTKPTEAPIDSTHFYVSGNSLGRRKNAAGGIVIGDYQNTFHKSGNYICNNIVTTGGSASVVIEEPLIPVYYSTTCEVMQPPVTPLYFKQIIRGRKRVVH